MLVLVLAFLLGVGLAIAREQSKQKTPMLQLFEVAARVGLDRFFGSSAVSHPKTLESGKLQDIGSAYGFLPLYAP